MAKSKFHIANHMPVTLDRPLNPPTRPFGELVSQNHIELRGQITEIGYEFGFFMDHAKPSGYE